MRKIECEKMLDKLKDFSKENGLMYLRSKYKDLLNVLYQKGTYIWGTAALGEFCRDECLKNGILFRGFIDNNSSRWDETNLIFSKNRLKPGDVVILATLAHSDIEETIKQGVRHIYYEELAMVDMRFSIYYRGFIDLFDEIELNKNKYMRIRDLLSDSLSKEVFDLVMEYRMSMDARYTREAYRISTSCGTQDFDEQIIKRMKLGGYTFFDVGGYDGETSERFVSLIQDYNKIVYFEPDGTCMKKSRQRLGNLERIEFVQAGVGCKNGQSSYTTGNNGGGYIDEDGEYAVQIVTLDEYINTKRAYIKLDVEGMEHDALMGMRKSIKEYKPLIGVSVYHLPGDIHNLVDLVLSWEPGYSIYMRHYTKTYADTIVYFISPENN